MPTVTVGVNVQGLGYSNVIPPDTNGAVGPNHFVEAINLSVGFYNKSNGSLISSKTLTSFFSGLGGEENFSDPVIEYDTYANKFVLCVLDYASNGSNSRVDFGVSNTSDPTGSWTLKRYDTTHDNGGGGVYQTDYPRMGYNADAYVIMLNQFGTPNHASTLSIRKSDLASFLYAWPTSMATIPGPAPAVIHDGSAGGPMWLVGTGSGSNIRVFKMTNELNSTPTINSFSVSVPSYSVMSAPRQPGGSMSWTLDTRVFNAAVRNNFLVAAHNVEVGTNDVARWYEFDISGATPTLAQSGNVSPGGTTDTYFPTIEINTANSLGMTYIESSSSEYMTTYVTGRTTSDATGTMETGAKVPALTGTSNYTVSRCGDYSGTTVDPSNGTTFWSANEFKGSSVWNTGFASYTVASAVTHCSVTSSANPVTAGTPFSITVKALDANNNVVTSYTGTVHFTSTDGQATLPANYTFTGGDAGSHTFTNGVTLRTAGSQTITATDAANGSITGNVTVTVNPAAANQLAVYDDANSPDVAGTLFDVTVTAQDPYGNTDTNYQGTVHFSSADPYGASLPADYIFQASDQGVATFAGETALYTAGTWDVTATDTQSGITGAAFVNVQAAPAVALQFVAPASASSGMAFDVTVIAVDPYGNTDMNYTGTIHFTTSDMDPGVVLPPDYAFQPSDAGMVTLAGGVTLITLGDQTLTATDTLSGITGTATVTVTSGAEHGVGGLGGKPAASEQPPSATVPTDPASPSAVSADPESYPARTESVATTAHRAVLIDHLWSDPADLFTHPWMDSLVLGEAS
jgi:hypothetical protein